MMNLLLTVSPGRLGLTIKVYKNDPQNGAVITEIDPACTFKNQLEIGDRIVTIDGRKVTKIEDLSLNKDRLRKFGIVKKKNQVAAADKREVSRENITTAATSATAVKAATEQLQQQQAMKQQYLIRTQQEQRAAKQQQNEKIEIPKHPMMGLSRRVNGNYNIVHQHENLKNIPKTQVISRLQTFIESLSQMKCISNRSRLHISCTCMQFLQNKKRVQMAMCHAILEYSYLPAAKSIADADVRGQPSLGHLVLALKWCRHYSSSSSSLNDKNTTPMYLVNSVAERASILLCTEVLLHDELRDSHSRRDETTRKINMQLLDLFGSDFDSSSLSAVMNEDILESIKMQLKDQLHEASLEREEERKMWEEQTNWDNASFLGGKKREGRRSPFRSLSRKTSSDFS